LTADHVAAGRITRSDLQSDGNALYWLESRPTEGGRAVLVRWDPSGEVTDHSPADVSIRSRVHEYGGGAVCLTPSPRPRAVHPAGCAFAFVNQVDQRVWHGAGPGTVPRALTPAAPAGQIWHHGGLSASPDGEWVLAVREVHTDSNGSAGAAPPRRSIVALRVPQDGDRPDSGVGVGLESVLLEGHDFYGTARLHPDGGRVVATAWDHPAMPWDASRLVVVALRLHTDAPTGRVTLVADGAPWEIAGGPDESVGQPAWRPDGTLRFVSDRAGWWQPYLHSGQAGAETPTAVTTLEAEFHSPDWILGQRTMVDLADGSLVVRVTGDGHDQVAIFRDPTAGVATPEFLATPLVAISGLCAHGDGVVALGATPDRPASFWSWAPAPAPAAAPAPAPALAPASVPAVPVLPAVMALQATDIAHGFPLQFEGRTGRPVHATLYRPTLTGANLADRTAAAPPLVVFCHSGPTLCANPGFDPAIQFFTTRGFAVATVDYAGSSGYGRAYRHALNGQWGIADAHDCLDTALHLATAHLVDPTRMAARGSSAGGFTALNALAAGEGFAACVSWYGVTDLLTLAATTHDFEAHYNDHLVGPLPETEALHIARSPTSHAADMTGAVLLLQGSDDPVVPLSQAQSLHDALRAAGRICELHVFEGEGHGFRRAETLSAAYEAELAFYRSHLHL
jgi:dipeptidyl aminopeptidase/acylaminoacyl peptidase